MSKLDISRRQALKAALFGPGCIGLKSLATGLPISVLLNGIPKDAHAIGGSPQYLVLRDSLVTITNMGAESDDFFASSNVSEYAWCA